MKSKDFYTNAHLIIAAIRILEHQNDSLPSIDDVCKILSFSKEQGNLIGRKLRDLGIIGMVKGVYGARLFIIDHLKIEEIPRDKKENLFEEEIKKFQSVKKDFAQKIESLQAEQKKKKKELFAELEQQIKNGLDKK